MGETAIAVLLALSTTLHFRDPTIPTPTSLVFYPLEKERTNIKDWRTFSIGRQIPFRVSEVGAERITQAGDEGTIAFLRSHLER